MKTARVVLVVDDEERIRRLLQAALTERGYRVVTAVDGDDAISKLAEPVDLILTDLKMPNRDGLEVLAHVRETLGDTPVILMTAFATVDSAVAAMKQGAYDYITKPFNIDEVEMLVDRAVATTTLVREHRYLRESEEQRLEDMIGSSEPMCALFDMIRRVAVADASVLITGETGTGKELVARAVHSLSPRNEHLFVAVNCAAIPRELLESELFGHARGAFTGASDSRTGKFELADGGTLLLDEIGDMSLDLQAKLLRVIEEGCLEKLGSNRQIRVDVRLISATNQQLEQSVEEGTFRKDLYYRLNVIHLRLAPLRERGPDIALLAEHFLTAFAARAGRPSLSLDSGALELLQSYDWPGNVRELRNICERLTVLSDSARVSVDVVAHLLDLPTVMSDGDEATSPASLGTLSEALARAEAQALAQALDKSNGNKAQAARLLGISERSLWYKLKKHPSLVTG